MSRRKLFIVGMIVIALLTAGCQEEGLLQLTLVTEGEHIFSGDIPGILIITGGEAALEPGAVVAGPIYQLDGLLRLEGTVREDLYIFAGDLILSDQAQILGNLNQGGGDIAGNPDRVVSGAVNTGTGLQIPEVDQPPRRYFLETAVRWIISGVILAGAALLVERRLPEIIHRVQEAVFRYGFVSGAMGVLVGIVGLSLVVLLAYTILLIPVALLGFAVMVFSVVWGWIAMGIRLGKWTADRYPGFIRERTAIAGVTFLFFIFLNLLNLIPFAGGILGITVALVSLGGVFLTRFGFRRFVPEQG